MTDEHAMQFVTQLARELSSRTVKLPSLPDVVLRIRKLLEEENCDFDMVAQAVGADAMLVSRLLIVANSAAYNVSGQNVESLDAAIGRLGFDLIRNTAIALAMKQMYLGDEHKHIEKLMRGLWRRSMQLSALSYSIADTHDDLDAETGYLCGLLHEVGKVYILTKSKDFPEFLGDLPSLEMVLDEWQAKIGQNILESWGFSAEICESADPSAHLSGLTHMAPTFADVTFVAERMLAAESDGAPNFETMPSSVKLGITDDVAADILVHYRHKLTSLREVFSE